VGEVGVVAVVTATIERLVAVRTDVLLGGQLVQVVVVDAVVVAVADGGVAVVPFGRDAFG
jgi:hypothetical protein